VLFVAHHPFGRTRTRTEHLVAHLAQQMEVHVLTFSVERPWRDLGRFVRPWMAPERNAEGNWIHEVPRFPRLHSLNSVVLTRVVKRIVRKFAIDIVVISPNQYMIGTLDIPAVGVPVICDYLDGTDWSHAPGHPRVVAEREYVKKADAVMCVSHGLTNQAASLNTNAYYVPNGVHVERYRGCSTVDIAESKARLGLDPSALTVSIIGLTCSPTLYFWDAVKRLHDRGVRIQLVLVGEGEVRKRILEQARGYEHVLCDFGRVPYSDVLTYFAASDVGLYPVDEHSYYHWASPLKVFEYAAMGKPVIISPKLEELNRIKLENFHFCDNSPDALAEAILDAGSLATPIYDPRIDEFDWARIATTCGNIVRSVSSQSRRPR
jgi:glycosyltransferase involved in cell wall biosynthesis